MTSPQQPTGARFWTIIAALAPPALVGAGFSTTVAEHPFLSVLILTTYFAVLFVTRVLKRVVEPAIEDWINRSTHTFYGLAWRYRAKYLERLEVSLKFVELLGAKTSTEFAVRLPDVYVDLSLKRRAADDSHACGIETDRRISLDELIDAQDGGVFVITGGPGSGKTTLLRFKALQLASRRTRGSRLPIVLELRHHVKAIVGDPACTVATLTAALDWLHGSHTADWIERQLQRGKCLIMLDGLDEVADEHDRRRVVNWVRAQTDRYRRNPFVVTSRPHGYRADRLSNADELAVRRFTSEQIHHFVHNWYRVTWIRRTNEAGDGIAVHAERAADDLIERLRRTPALFKLAENPLLLTMITNVHITGKVLPGSRASLYGEICEMLLHKRDEAKAMRGTDEGLTVEQKLQVSRTLAAYMMHNRVRDLSVEEARQAVRDPLAGASRKVTADEFLVASENSGLIVQPVEGQYAFAHLSFQEYLAAMALRETNGSAALAASVDDPWWREVTLLWSAGANATAVVEACLTSGSAQALRLALSCADEARDIAPEIRARLDRLRRAVDDEEDLARRHALIAAKVAHALGDLVWLGEETVFVARPVDTGLYGLHLRDLDLHPRGPVLTDPGEVRLKLWDVDVSRFVDWVNGLPGIGASFRLPTGEEAAEAVGRGILGSDDRAIWVRDGARPALFGESSGSVSGSVRRRFTTETRPAVTWLDSAVKPIRVAALHTVFTQALADIDRFTRLRTPSHQTMVDGLLERLLFAQSVHPSRRLTSEIDALRTVRGVLRDAERERHLGEVGDNDVIVSLQQDYERETDKARKSLLERQLREAKGSHGYHGDPSAILAAAEHRAMSTIEKLRSRLLKSRAHLDRLLGEQYPEFRSRVGLDTAVEAMLAKYYAQAATAAGGVPPVSRVVLLGAWNERRLRVPQALWASVSVLERELKDLATPTATSPPVRFGVAEAMLDSVRGELMRREPDLAPENWRSGVMTLIEYARTRLARLATADIPVDPDVLASVRVALAVAALPSMADGEPRRLLRRLNAVLALAEDRAFAPDLPPEVLLLVRA